MQKLFRDDRLSAYLTQRKRDLNNEVDSFEAEYILNTPEKELIECVVNRYSLKTPILNEKGKYAEEPEEIYVSVKSEWLDEPAAARKGLRIRIIIPFDGDGILFNLQPSTYSISGVPFGEVKMGANELALGYDTLEKDPKKVEQLWQKDLSEINKNLSWVEKDVSQFNKEIEQIAKEAIIKRKKDVAEKQSFTSSLGIPIRKKKD